MLKNKFNMIIGITGNMGSGKTTVANLLVNEKNTYIPKEDRSLILPFSQPIKDIAKQIGWNGKKDKKGRRLLQLIGTECGRDCIDNDIWLTHWEKHFSLQKKEFNRRYVIADDIRFENEAVLIQKLDGKIVYVHRPGYNGDDHVSEKHIKKIKYDYIIENVSDLESLSNKVSKLHYNLEMCKLLNSTNKVKIHKIAWN